MKRLLAMALATAWLTGCTGEAPRLLDGLRPKANTQTTTQTAGTPANPLVMPPRETWAVAGPGAEKELDYETLEGPGAVDPEAAPDLSATPEPEMAATETVSAPKPKKPKPGDTVIKAVAVTSVVGSPGRGNAELAEAMRSVLGEAGWPVIKSPRKDALTVKGKVELGQVHEGKQLVRLTWVVLEPNGSQLGDLKQENIVPAGSLDKGWGENAMFASQAAAEGIYRLIKPLM